MPDSSPRHAKQTPFASPRGRRVRRRRMLAWLACLLLGGGVAAELSARYILGLGDPPLYMLDDQTEYRLVPHQRCRRFGHEFVVNSWSMRSPELTMPKPATEQRVLVIGDSVVNGGGRIDQSELATTLLSKPVPNTSGASGTPGTRVAANVSAGSWGPPNELAYAKKFGLFQADAVVIVLNSDDEADVPGLEYIGSAWPRTRPSLALQELIGGYGWKALCKLVGRAPEPPPPPHLATHEQDVEACRQALLTLVNLARQAGARVAVVQYLKRSELRGTPQPGFATIGEWIREAGVESVSTRERFSAALAAGDDPFQVGDDVHPNARGQRLLAEVIEQVLK